MKKYDGIPVKFLAGRLAEFCGVDFNFFSKMEMEGRGKEGKNDTSPDAAEQSVNPILVDSDYRNQMMRMSDEQQEPLIHMDEYRVVYLCLKGESGYFFFGPIALRAMDRVELHRFYRNYGVKSAEDRPFPILSVSKILLLAQMAAGIILNCEYTEDELLKANTQEIKSLNPETDVTKESFSFHFSMQEEDQESYHHTYQEERRITRAVEEGRTEDAVRLSMSMDDKMGTMGAGYLEQMQRTAITAITVCTRAAIQGGISPAEAYQISDFSMQKLDQCTNAASLTACRNEAIQMLTDRVRKKKEQRTVSSYVDACCDYVGKHYREKIYLDDIAEKMGISPTYLSRLFSKEKGMTLQEYVLRIRVDRAANLLTYSDSPIAEIGDYVNFPSQSYFGRVFKKYTGLTPKQYRNAHKPREFTV